jgi:hypothetical protein
MYNYLVEIKFGILTMSDNSHYVKLSGQINQKGGGVGGKYKKI